MGAIGAAQVEELEIDLLLEGIFQRFGFDFRGYRRAPLKNTLQNLMRSEGVQTISALQDRVMHDQRACDALLRALSMHSFALFDDAEHFRALREVLGGWLGSCPFPKIWIAECTSAEEACTLAILLAEEGLYDKTQIFATMSNEALLQEASGGSFALDRLEEYEENYRRSGGRRTLSDYCSKSNGRAVILPRILANITWAQYNLVTDASFNEFQLIICRKTLPHYGTVLRHRILQLFHESLSLFGMLSIDDAQDLDNAPFATRYRAISPQQGLYRRVV